MTTRFTPASAAACASVALPATFTARKAASGSSAVSFHDVNARRKMHDRGHTFQRSGPCIARGEVGYTDDVATEITGPTCIANRGAHVEVPFAQLPTKRPPDESAGTGLEDGHVTTQLLRRR